MPFPKSILMKTLPVNDNNLKIEAFELNADTREILSLFLESN